MHHSPQTIKVQPDSKAAAAAAAAVEARVRQQEAEGKSKAAAATAEAWIRQQVAEEEAAAKEAVWLRQIDEPRKSMSRANTIVFPSPASSSGKRVGDGQEPGGLEDRPKTGFGQNPALETRGPCGRCGLPVLTSHLRYVAGGCYYHQVLLPGYSSRVPLHACVCLLCGHFGSLV